MKGRISDGDSCGIPLFLSGEGQGSGFDLLNKGLELRIEGIGIGVDQEWGGKVATETATKAPV